MIPSALLLPAVASLLVPAGVVPEWRALNEAARHPVQANDYAKLRKTFLELKPLLPGNRQRKGP